MSSSTTLQLLLKLFERRYLFGISGSYAAVRAVRPSSQIRSQSLESPRHVTGERQSLFPFRVYRLTFSLHGWDLDSFFGQPESSTNDAHRSFHHESENAGI
jgi:hypothetical protein